MSIELGSQRLIDEDGTIVHPDGSTAEEDLLIIASYGATFSLTTIQSAVAEAAPRDVIYSYVGAR